MMGRGEGVHALKIFEIDRPLYSISPTFPLSGGPKGVGWWLRTLTMDQIMFNFTRLSKKYKTYVGLTSTSREWLSLIREILYPPLSFYQIFN